MVKNIVSKGRTYLRENLGFCILLGVELVVGIWLFLSLFHAAYSLDISTADISKNDGTTENITRDGDVLQIENSEGNTDVIKLLSGEYAMHAGAYYITVCYQSVADPDAPTNSVYDSTGEMLFYSPNDPSAVSMDTLTLDDAHTSVTGRVWVATGSRLSDFKLQLTYEGTGLLQISSIHLQECRWYRVLRLLKFLLLFVLVDLVYYLLWSHQKKVGWSISDRMKTGLMLLGLTALSSLPEFSNYLLQGDDIFFHIQRIVAVAQELRYGQFPVRMMTDMINGYGYASSLYYCDIFLYLPAILYNMMLPLRTCYQIYVVGINLGTAWIAYYCFGQLTRDKKITWLGTALYLFAAYRMTDLYIRASLGEYTAMMFLPLVVLGIYRIFQSEKPHFREWWPLTLGMAGVLCSHLLSCEMTAILIILCCVLTFPAIFRKGRIFAFMKAGIATCLLDAWFLLPLLDSMKHMNLASYGSDKVVEKIQSLGLYPVQVFALFGNGTGNGIAGGMQSEFSLTIGFALVLGLFVVGYSLYKRSNWSLENVFSYKVLRVSSMMAIITIVLTLEIFPWDATEGLLGSSIARVLTSIQYGWRYLSFTTILLVVAVILALDILKQYQRNIWMCVYAALCASMVISAGFFFYQFASNTSEVTYNSDTNQSSMSVENGEYFLDNTDYTAINSNLAESSSDNCVITNYQKEEGIAYLTVSSTDAAESEVSVPIFNYLNYVAEDEDTGEMFGISTGENNRISIDIPAGYAGTIKIFYQPPRMWHVAEWVSVLAWLAVFGRTWFVKRIRPKKQLQ